jgi:predicted ATP-grasp superfamily ATP-dependent carboligase
VATSHVTEWMPELREPALALLGHVGLRGMAQVEFMRDDRDGVDKLIECNVRFTQPISLIAAAGIDLPWLVYRQAAGLPYEVPRGFRQGVRLWDPQKDLQAFRELRDRGEITLGGWLRTLRPARLDSLSVRDPMPSAVPLSRALRRKAATLLGKDPSA